MSLSESEISYDGVRQGPTWIVHTDSNAKLLKITIESPPDGKFNFDGPRADNIMTFTLDELKLWVERIESADF